MVVCVLKVAGCFNITFSGELLHCHKLICVSCIATYVATFFTKTILPLHVRTYMYIRMYVEIFL